MPLFFKHLLHVLRVKLFGTHPMHTESPPTPHFAASFLRWPLLATFALLLGALVCRNLLITFFFTNVYLNTAIIVCVTLGIAYSLFHTWQVQKGFLFFKAWAPDFLPEHIENAPLWLYKIFGAPPSSDKKELYRTLLSTRLETALSLLTYLISISVFLGLIGTFWGLSLTIQGVVSALTNLDLQNADGAPFIFLLKDALQQPLGGMQTAFSTSLFGMLGALVLGFFSMKIKGFHRHFESVWCVFEAHCKRAWLLKNEKMHAEMGWLEPLKVFWQEISSSLEKTERLITLQQNEQKLLRDGMLHLSHALKKFVITSEEAGASAQTYRQDIQQIAQSLQTFVLRYQDKGLHFETSLTRFLETFFAQLESHLSATQKEMRSLSSYLGNRKDT